MLRRRRRKLYTLYIRRHIGYVVYRKTNIQLQEFFALGNERGKVKQKDKNKRVNVIMENILVITELTLLLKNFFRISPAAKT